MLSFSILLFLIPSNLVSVLSTEVDTITHEDHNHHRLLQLLSSNDDKYGIDHEARGYEPEFRGFDRSIIGRAQDESEDLVNNAPEPREIDQGDIQFWRFPKEAIQSPHDRSGSSGLPLNLISTNTTALELNLLQLYGPQNATGSSQSVYLTISTCDQPLSDGSTISGAPPQLEVYISFNSGNKKPDNGHNDEIISVDGGYGNLTLSDVADDIFIGVRAPTGDGFSGSYNYELAASIDGNYASYIEEKDAFLPWDTDSNSALLATSDITNEMSNSTLFSQWLTLDPPPFHVYVNNQGNSVILGLQRSVCGLRKHAQVNASETKMVKIGGQPKQLFYINGLNGSSSYDAFMTFEKVSGNTTVGGGGAVWNSTGFGTKSDSNCQIIYDLNFCTDVAYAVPSNFSNFSNDMVRLRETYDNNTSSAYQGFNKSLQQVPCETTSSAQYSLARTCQNCDNAYRAWICAVTIPRCDVFSADAPYLLPRSTNSSFFANGSAVPAGEPDTLFSQKNKSSTYFGSSRNPLIDDLIKPGPYKEKLPCKELCYHLMQDCPATLQFACPLEGHGLNHTYGRIPDCNWPGRPNPTSAANVGALDLGLALVVFGALVWMDW